MTPSTTMRARRRDTGISALGELPSSTHFALFYETREDLLDVIVPFFAAGLKANELCVWLPSVPTMERAALSRLREQVPDFHERMARGDVKVIRAADWYRPHGVFDAKALVAKWRMAIEGAERDGYTAVRGSGDLTWIGASWWKRFNNYERALHRFMKDRNAMVVCTAPLKGRRATDILDSVCNHHFAVARRQGEWQVLETPELKKTKAEIQRQNRELEKRIAERTREVARTVAKLAKAKRDAREAELKAEFRAALDERSRLAREIHDSLLQGVTGIALQLRAALPHLDGAAPPAIESARGVVELAESTIREARRAIMDMRAPTLVEEGLPVALERAIRRLPDHQHLDFAVRGRQGFLAPEIEDTIFRVGQEAVLNAIKHSGGDSIAVCLTYTPRGVTLTVHDNGHGFPVEQAFRAYAGRWGLLGMRERADRIGATLSVRSSAADGTTVTLQAVRPGRPPARKGRSVR